MANSKQRKAEEYFSKIGNDYADRIMAIQPKLYENSAKIINDILAEQGENASLVLDIGNGGVINYDYKLIKRLICADLYISETARNKYRDAPNIEFEVSNIYQMNYSDEFFDVVIVQAVIHHLAGRDLNTTYANVKCAIDECMRVLKPNGFLLILESTVTPWFEKIEQLVYPLMQLWFKLCKFGCVYQFSSGSLNAFIKREGWEILETQNVGLDQYVWIMNRKILSKLTPCRFTKICIKK